MKSEFHSVINEFQRLLNEYNFKCPKKLWYDDLICLSKHIIDIYYCYIISVPLKSRQININQTIPEKGKN